MTASQLDVVTGATGYTGKYITARLLAMGRQVRNLTGRSNRPNPFKEKLATVPFRFDDPAELAHSLEGTDVLYNTYWVRFSHGRQSYDRAVENTLKLIDAAKQAGVRLSLIHI